MPIVSGGKGGSPVSNSGSPFGGGNFPGGSSAPAAPGTTVASGNFTGGKLKPSVPKGASAKAKPNASSGSFTYFPQPQFDSRIYSLVFPMASAGSGQSGAVNGGLTRGFMAWAAPITTNGYGGQRASVNFLYNPTTITASYNMDASDVSAALLYRQPGDYTSAIFAMNQMVSFSLLFDRTFELWGAYNSNATPKGNNAASAAVANPSITGVNADVMAMMQLTGMMLTSQQNQQSGVTNPDGANKTVAPITGTQGVMTLIPTWLFLGALAGGLNYYGYVSDWSVTYTHFSQYMVPMRCAVNVDFALLVPPGTDGKANSPGEGQSFISNVIWSTEQLGKVNNQGSSNNAGAFAPNSPKGTAGR
jgi:hypothetical protein